MSIHYFILPAFNEGDGIYFQLTSLKKLLKDRNLEHEIVIVNDGSTDETAREAERMNGILNVHLINHSTNRGPGMAFKSGFEYILPKLGDDDIIFTMDCDNTQHIRTLELMMNKIHEGYEVVLGSIFTMGGMAVGVPFFRLVMSHGARWVYKICFPIKGINDYTAFCRAIKGSALKLAYERYQDKLIESSGFGCMAEMLIKFRQIPLFITEVPMIVRYDLKTSSSKLKVMKTVQEHFRNIRRHVFKRHLF